MVIPCEHLPPPRGTFRKTVRTLDPRSLSCPWVLRVSSSNPDFRGFSLHLWNARLQLAAKLPPATCPPQCFWSFQECLMKAHQHFSHLLLWTAPPPCGIWLPVKPLECGDSSQPLLPRPVMAVRLFSCPGGVCQTQSCSSRASRGATQLSSPCNQAASSAEVAGCPLPCSGLRPVF